MRSNRFKGQDLDFYEARMLRLGKRGEKARVVEPRRINRSFDCHQFSKQTNAFLQREHAFANSKASEMFGDWGDVIGLKTPDSLSRSSVKVAENQIRSCGSRMDLNYKVKAG